MLDEGTGAFEFLFVADEADAVEVDVGQVESRGAALGHLLGFVEVRSERLEGQSTIAHRFIGAKPPANSAKSRQVRKKLL